ncbi:MAG: hypothetical protein JWQ49_6706 [Edaphobacter sp.]|nr:hypothetical protein [Edaphobacter sp.]
MKLFCCANLFLGFFAFAVIAQGQTTCPKNPKHTASVTYGVYDTGESLEGPVCVEVYYNALRNDVFLTDTVTSSAGPDPTTALKAPQPAGGAAPAAADSATQVQAELTAFEGTLRIFASQHDAITLKLVKSLAALSNLVDLSNGIFGQGGAPGATRVLSLITTPTITTALQDGESTTWEPSDSLNTTLLNLKDRARALQASSPNAADAAILKLVQTNITSDLTTVAPYMIGGDKTNNFLSQKKIFGWWDQRIKGLTPASFTAEVYVECRISTNISKSNAIKVSGVDNFPRFAGQPATALTIGGAVATVTCTTPIAISVGVDISFLKSPAYGLVPSGATGSNQFGITDNGGTNPMPIAMVHWMFFDFARHKVGFYGSFGTAAHVQSAAAGGSAVEFLSGLSFGFFRTVFVSPGWQLGKVSQINGGYKIGDPVPTGVTTAPVTSSYNSGFGLAFTFTKP